jgi:hypothetical protein
MPVWLPGFFLAAFLAPLPIQGIPVWDTDIEDQQGQFTFYNSKVDGAFFGLPVDAGDFNGDGKTDLAISPMAAGSGPAGTRNRAGEVYVLRGDGSFVGSVDHAQFTNETFPGLTILGARQGDFLGVEMFSANVNGDAYEDLIVGAQNYDGVAGNRSNCGGAFVILGGPDVLADGSVLDLNFDPESPPPGLITIIGERSGDRLGLWVEAGDFDGDTIKDLALGGDQSVGANPGLDKGFVGMTAILYGRETFPAVIDLADGPETLADVAFFYGKDANDHFGSTVHGADIDGDGQDELVISASLNRLSASYSDDSANNPARPSGGGDGPQDNRTFAGEVYILYSDGINGRFTGRTDLAESPLPAAIDDRLSIIYGDNIGDLTGEELASGDFDGNDLDELCLGGLTARSPTNQSQAGVAYVIYGLDLVKGSDLDLDDIGSVPEGLTVRAYYGHRFNMIFGDTMITGDYNFDGFKDLTIGVPHTSDEGEPGQMVMLYGGPDPFADVTFPLFDSEDNTLDRALVLGPDGGDNFSYSLDSLDWDGDGYWDVIANAMRGDGPNDTVQDVGEAHVISGYHFSDTVLSLDSIEPAKGPVGQITEVILHGTGFTLGSQVFLGLDELAVAESVEVINANEIRATFPAYTVGGAVGVSVQTMHGSTDSNVTFTYQAEFLRGDTDNDGSLSINDAILTASYLFLVDTAFCLDAHDADDSGEIDITDVIRNLFFQLLGGMALPAPYPDPGTDPTADGLGCSR